MTGDVAHWLAEAHRHLDLSRGADSLRELQGDLEDALAAYQQVLAREADHLEALQASADLLLRLDRFDEALDVLTVLRARPDRTVAVSARAAEVFQRQKRFEPALEAWGEVLAARSHDLQALTGRAFCLMGLARDEEALAAWNAVLPLTGVTSETLSDASRWTFDTLDRAKLQARVHGAALTERLGRPGAVDALESVFSTHLRELVGALTPVNLRELLASSPAAREALQRVEARQPPEPNAWRFIARVWMESAGWEHALRCARQALALEAPAAPNDLRDDRRDDLDRRHAIAADHATCGWALVSLGRPEEALPEFDRAEALWPTYHPPKLGRAKALEALGRAR